MSNMFNFLAEDSDEEDAPRQPVKAVDISKAPQTKSKTAPKKNDSGRDGGRNNNRDGNRGGRCDGH